MLLVPPSTFQMGCIIGSDDFGCNFAAEFGAGDELPVHQVTLTNPFYLGRYEVTQSEWSSQMGLNPSQFTGRPDSAIRPVETMTFYEVEVFLYRTGFRLPTEAEWECACRAQTEAPFYNGLTDDSTVGALAWYALNSGSETRPVGGKLANALGFHDMLGNVWERVSDRYSEYPGSPQTNPTGPTTGEAGGDRVSRGGGYVDFSGSVRCSFRRPTFPDWAFSDLGVRVAKNP
jgi:formylglycine-generating enzyme required for sulfatase activity